jgi:hypothetical protein
MRLFKIKEYSSTWNLLRHYFSRTPLITLENACAYFKLFSTCAALIQEYETILSFERFLDIEKSGFKNFRYNALRPTSYDSPPWQLPSSQGSMSSSFWPKKSITGMEHPSNSPDLASSEFWLFSKIKSALKGWIFQDTEGIKIMLPKAIPQQLKVKVNLSLCFFSWAPQYEGVRGEWKYSSTHSLNSALDGGKWWASHAGCFIPGERSPGSHWRGGWAGPRAGLDAVVKNKISNPRRESNPRTRTSSP